MSLLEALAVTKLFGGVAALLTMLNSCATGVAVMNIEVNHRNALQSLRQRVGGSDADVVEYAKTHRPTLCCMVAARAHRAERVPGTSGDQFIDRQQACTGRTPRRREAMRVHCRIGVELHITLRRRVLENEVDIGRIVHSLQVIGIGKWCFQAAQLLEQP